MQMKQEKRKKAVNRSEKYQIAHFSLLLLLSFQSTVRKKKKLEKEQCTRKTKNKIKYLNEKVESERDITYANVFDRFYIFSTHHQV